MQIFRSQIIYIRKIKQKKKENKEKNPSGEGRITIKKMIRTHPYFMSTCNLQLSMVVLNHFPELRFEWCFLVSALEQILVNNKILCIVTDDYRAQHNSNKFPNVIEMKSQWCPSGVREGGNWLFSFVSSWKWKKIVREFVKEINTVREFVKI